MTYQDIVRLRKIAYWLNQNALIRLYDLLDCWRVVGNNIRIRRDYEGYQELDILRRLRHLFSHAGSLDESNGEHSVLLSRIMDHFKPHSRVSHVPGEFPLQIDEVVKVIFENVKGM